MNDTSRFARLAPLSGIAYALFFIAVSAFEGDELSDKASASKVMAYWSDRADTRLLVATLSGLGVLFLVMFAASLRGALRSHEPAEGSASAVAFGGAILAAGGLALSAMLTLGASRAADLGATDTVVTLNHLGQAAWLPSVIGFGTMLLATGVGGLLSGAFPKVVCWIAVVLGVAFLSGTIAGIVAYIATPLWIIAVSVILFRRSSRTESRVAGGSP